MTIVYNISAVNSHSCGCMSSWRTSRAWNYMAQVNVSAEIFDLKWVDVSASATAQPRFVCVVWEFSHLTCSGSESKWWCQNVCRNRSVYSPWITSGRPLFKCCHCCIFHLHLNCCDTPQQLQLSSHLWNALKIRRICIKYKDLDSVRCDDLMKLMNPIFLIKGSLLRVALYL